MKRIKEIMQITLALVAITALVTGLVFVCWLSFKAYKERFPHAPAWTYFVK